MAPSCSISPPIVGVVNGDDTEMAYFVIDILLQEFQNSWQNIRPATFRTLDLEIEEQIHIRVTCSSVIATYKRMRNSTLFGCAFSGQMEQRTIPKVSTLKILTLPITVLTQNIPLPRKMQSLLHKRSPASFYTKL